MRKNAIAAILPAHHHARQYTLRYEQYRHYDGRANKHKAYTAFGLGRGFGYFFEPYALVGLRVVVAVPDANFKRGVRTRMESSALPEQVVVGQVPHIAERKE